MHQVAEPIDHRLRTTDDGGTGLNGLVEPDRPELLGQTKISWISHQRLQSLKADRPGYGLLLCADRARSFVEHVLDVGAEDASSFDIGPGDSNQLDHAQAVGISRQPVLVGEIPETGEDARPGL